MGYSKASTYKLLEVILTILLDPMYITKITCITISMKLNLKILLMIASKNMNI